MSEPMRYRGDKSDMLRKPIVDEAGNNPFADPGGAEIPDDIDNIFAPPQDTTRESYRPHGYVAALERRSGMIFGFGLTGLIISFVSLIAFQYVPPLALANLGLTFWAWVKGRQELKAIAVGAVRDSNRGKARAGMIMGIVATGISIVAAGIGFYYWFYFSPPF